MANTTGGVAFHQGSHLAVPPFHADGVGDDTAALQWWIDHGIAAGLSLKDVAAEVEPGLIRLRLRWGALRGTEESASKIGLGPHEALYVVPPEWSPAPDGSVVVDFASAEWQPREVRAHDVGTPRTPEPSPE